jgi:diguanylate cyclase (GGDEF)-like protein
LCEQRRRVIGYVLTIEAGVLAMLALSTYLAPVQRGDLGYFAVLMGCCLGYGEASRRIERLRQHDGSPHMDLNSVWMFAGVLLLHPVLVAILIAGFHLHRWLRVAHRIVHRVVFSATAAIGSAVAATGFLALVGRYDAFEHDTRDLRDFALIAGAACVFLLANSVLISTVVALAAPRPSVSTATAEWSDYGLEAATLALGAMLGWALVDWPVMVLPIIGVTFVLHGKVLFRQLQEAARRDAKTGLLNTVAWYEAARREIVRAGRHGGTVGVLVIDLDHFKQVNDDHGHLAGDEVLLAVAGTIAAEVRGYDVVGRFGGEEFLALLPDVDGPHLVQVAERIRVEIAKLVLPINGHRGVVLFRGLTASIGIAVFPQHGETLDRLVRAADGALFRAKTAGRNQIQLAGATAKTIIAQRSPAHRSLPDALD